MSVRVEYAIFKSPAGVRVAVYLPAVPLDGPRERSEAHEEIRRRIISRVSSMAGRVHIESLRMWVFPDRFWWELDGIGAVPDIDWTPSAGVGRDAYDALFRGSERERAEAEREAADGRRANTRSRASYSGVDWGTQAPPVGATSGTFRADRMWEVFEAYFRDRQPPRSPPPPPPRRPAPPPPIGPYAELGIAADADRSTARARYHQLAREHHPDAGGDAERMKRITAAWAQVRRHRGW